MIHLGGFSGTPDFGGVEMIAFSAVKNADAAAVGVSVATATESVGRIIVDLHDRGV